MRNNSSAQTGFARRLVDALLILGLGLIISSVAVDYLPTARPGFNSFQLLLLIAGLMITLAIILLRRANAGGPRRRPARENLLMSIVASLVSLVALELVLALASLPSHYPAEIPPLAYEPAPWWTCDESGCHYVAAHMHEVCDSSPNSVWPCVINQQGFHDRQDFVWDDELDGRLRIITLGDSFTFGLSAPAGQSYVDVIESRVANSVVWNTGISGIGTKQALASFRAFAPVMQAHIAIYGMYVNDFDDNLLPIDGYFVGVNADGRPIGIRNHRVDKWGNLTKLEQATAVFYHEHGVDPPSSDPSTSDDALPVVLASAGDDGSAAPEEEPPSEDASQAEEAPPKVREATAREAAAHLGISRATITRWAQKNPLLVVRYPEKRGQAMIVDLEAVLAHARSTRATGGEGRSAPDAADH